MAAAGCALDVDPGPVTPPGNDTEQSLDPVLSPTLPVTGGAQGIVPALPQTTTEPSKPTPDPWNGVNATKPTPDPWEPDESGEDDAAEGCAEACGTETQGSAIPPAAN